MSFDRFLLAIESHDLSQADKSFIGVHSSAFFFNFTKLQFLNDKIYSYTKKLSGTWQFDFIIQIFARLKSKHFSQFFW